MDFTIAKCEFDRALRQILQGRKDTLGDVVDMTADRSTLTVVATGRSIEVPIKTEVIGSVTIPIKVVFSAKRISENYKDERLRLRISDGKFCIQNTSISNPGIAMKRIARRIIDIPDDARPMDILALRHVFSVDEIEDSGLHARVLDAQSKLTRSMESASMTLRDCGFEQAELIVMAETKINTHGVAMKRVLFENGQASEDQLLAMAKKLDDNDSSAALWLERGKSLVNQEKWIEAHECFVAGLKIEPADPEIMCWMGILCWDAMEIAEKLGVNWKDLPFDEWDADQWFHRSARAGWAEAQFRCYELSKFSVRWLRKAAAQGHGQAAWTLTIRILCGDEYGSGLDDAVYWFYKAKAAGVGKFSETLEIVQSRQTTAKNSFTPHDWTLKVAQYGDGEASFELATFQFLALSMEDSLDEVVSWLEKAEEEGVGTIDESLKKLRAERRKRQCQLAASTGDSLAFMYAEWADRSAYEFTLCFDARDFMEEKIDTYINHHPGVKLGKTPWWKVPGGPDYIAIDWLGLANRIMNRKVGAQPVPVLHEDVPAETQLGFFALGLAVEHAFGIGRTLVSLVAALLPVKADGGIARILIFGRLHLLAVGAVLAHEALEAGPSLDQCAVRSEMFIAGPAFLARKVIDLRKEQLGYVSREHPFIVLSKDAVVEATLTELTVQEPEPEQIVAQLLAKEPFAAHTIEGSQDARLEQLLRWDAGTPLAGIEFVEQGRELLQNCIHAALDSSQGMVSWDTVTEVYHGQEVGLGLRFSAHAHQTQSSNILFKEYAGFSTAC